MRTSSHVEEPHVIALHKEEDKSPENDFFVVEYTKISPESELWDGGMLTLNSCAHLFSGR